jgi:hypothetical protein
MLKTKGLASFKLSQNLTDSQLYLVVQDKLDREKIQSYSFTVVARDGGRPHPLTGTLNMNVELVDINDNNPVFEKPVYRFTLSESTKIDTIIGQVKASDADQGANGLIRYSLIDNNNNNKLSDQRFGLLGNMVQSSKSMLKYFDLDESTGVLRLKHQLDFEDESFFSLTVEAKDSGVGSLPAHATIEISVQDVNDNEPDINVSFLNTLFKNMSRFNGLKYDVYIPENTKPNKFLAHVSIQDKDSDMNGKLDWKILVNNELFYESRMPKPPPDNADTYLRLIKLNNNSFTLNVGSSQLMDREKSCNYGKFFFFGSRK